MAESESEIPAGWGQKGVGGRGGAVTNTTVVRLQTELFSQAPTQTVDTVRDS